MFKFVMPIIFLLFSYLQYNDGQDAYIWALIYFMTASVIVFNSFITKYKIFLLLSLCSFLFIQIIDSFMTKIIVEDLFYELGGILIVIITCKTKLNWGKSIEKK